LIIKSHIRGGYRSAAEYLKEQGKNEKIRLVEISDPEAANLDEAFHNMWVVASDTQCKKPLHHISINPMKGEWLTDAQVLAIVERCEAKYGYQMFHHQRVIVEHVKDGRQHFHVIWNRVSLMTGKTVWPGEHWKKSKQVCREMEKELGLKTPIPKRIKRTAGSSKKNRKKPRALKTQRRISRNPKLRNPTIRLTVQPSGRLRLKISGTAFKGRGTNAGTFRRFDRPSPANVTSVKAAATTYPREKDKTVSAPAPFRPVSSNNGWPPEAIADWRTWGRMNPRAFFTKWPELAS